MCLGYEPTDIFFKKTNLLIAWYFPSPSSIAAERLWIPSMVFPIPICSCAYDYLIKAGHSTLQDTKTNGNGWFLTYWACIFWFARILTVKWLFIYLQYLLHKPTLEIVFPFPMPCSILSSLSPKFNMLFITSVTYDWPIFSFAFQKGLFCQRPGWAAPAHNAHEVGAHNA